MSPFISSEGVFVGTDSAIAHFVPDCENTLGVDFFRGDALTYQEMSDLFSFVQNHRLQNILNEFQTYSGFIVGNRPFDKEFYLMELVKRRIILTENPDSEDQYIILGTNLSEVDWEKLIPFWNRAKIYTQRRFLNYLDNTEVQNQDEATINYFLNMCHRHADGYFEWPHTNIYPSRFMLPAIDAPGNGILAVCGYRVGNNGERENVRREVLRKIYLETLPYVESIDYMNEWGQENSPARLEKMANSIATFARNALRMNQNYEKAIREWTTDLAWLKREFYDTMHWAFAWPKIN